jgi:hypothetical protein
LYEIYLLFLLLFSSTKLSKIDDWIPDGQVMRLDMPLFRAEQ